MTQEVGIISLANNTRYTTKDFTVGGTLRIIPEHSCLTAYLYEKYYVIDENDDIVDTYVRCRSR